MTAQDAVGKALEAAHAEAGKADAAGNPAARDAWQLVIAELRRAREAIDFASKVK